MFEMKQPFKRIVGGIGALLSLTACSHHAAEVPSRPNVIVILTDDQGWAQNGLFQDRLDPAKCAPEGFLEQYDCDRTKAMYAAGRSMPFLRKMAKEGVLMTDAYVASPICGPSRAALLTARYPQRYGIYYNNDILATGVPASAHLTPLLQQSGYRTAMIGKWHVAKPVWKALGTMARENYKNWITQCVDGQHPLDCGFDFYYGFNNSGTPYFNSPNIFQNREGDPIKQTQYSTDEFTDQALQFIDENRSNPFFIYLAYNAVHTPMEDLAPEKYMKRFNTGNRDADNYYAYLAAIDDGIGRIIDRLKQYQMDENTLIIFLSDNGGVVASPFPVNGEFKGFKGQLRDGGTRVPMVMRWPGKLPAGTRYEHPVSSMDVLPTALAVAGLDAPDSLALDGKSLLPYLTGLEKTAPHEYLFWAGPQMLFWGAENRPFWNGMEDYLKERVESLPATPYPQSGAGSPACYSVRKGSWIYRFTAPDQVILFDVTKDPNGEVNLASAHPEVAAELKDVCNKWLKTLVAPAKWDRELWNKLFLDQD